MPYLDWASWLDEGWVVYITCALPSDTLVSYQKYCYDDWIRIRLYKVALHWIRGHLL